MIEKFFAIFLVKSLEKVKYIYKRLYWKCFSRNLKKIGIGASVEYPFFIIGERYISIGENFMALSGMRIEAYDQYGNQKFEPEITIGSDVKIGKDCHIGSINKIIIGDHTLIASKVLILDHSHGKIVSEENFIPPAERELYSKGKIEIGKRVWIGENVVILSGVKIGDNVIIGANSVVNKDIPDNYVAAGNPVRIIKKL